MLSGVGTVKEKVWVKLVGTAVDSSFKAKASMMSQPLLVPVEVATQKDVTLYETGAARWQAINVETGARRTNKVQRHWSAHTT